MFYFCYSVKVKTLKLPRIHSGNQIWMLLDNVCVHITAFPPQTEITVLIL